MPSPLYRGCPDENWQHWVAKIYVTPELCCPASHLELLSQWGNYNPPSSHLKPGSVPSTLCFNSWFYGPKRHTLDIPIQTFSFFFFFSTFLSLQLPIKIDLYTNVVGHILPLFHVPYKQFCVHGKTGGSGIGVRRGILGTQKKFKWEKWAPEKKEVINQCLTVSEWNSWESHQVSRHLHQLRGANF